MSYVNSDDTAMSSADPDEVTAMNTICPNSGHMHWLRFVHVISSTNTVGACRESISLIMRWAEWES